MRTDSGGRKRENRGKETVQHMGGKGNGSGGENWGWTKQRKREEENMQGLNTTGGSFEPPAKAKTRGGVIRSALKRIKTRITKTQARKGVKRRLERARAQ